MLAEEIESVGLFAIVPGRRLVDLGWWRRMGRGSGEVLSSED